MYIRHGWLWTKNSIQHDQNALSDIRTMHDFAYTVPNETREEF